jgi:nucleoside-diphosphate-sugar epimerase
LNTGPLPQDDPTQRCPDVALARNLLGWAPKFALEDGLQSTIVFARLFADVARRRHTHPQQRRKQS